MPQMLHHQREALADGVPQQPFEMRLQRRDEKDYLQD